MASSFQIFITGARRRSLIADALEVRGVDSVEILSETDWRMHRLTPFAHVEGREITYPPE